MRKGKKSRKGMKWTKRGAIVGGIWGLLALPIYWVFGYIYWEQSVPILLEKTLFFILFLPSVLIRPLFEILNLPEKMILGLFLNFVGWILIGGTVGYLFGLIMGGKR